MAICYHAILVNKNGIVEHIEPCGTLETEKEKVKYWTKGKYKEFWENSFVAKNPLTFNEGDKIK